MSIGLTGRKCGMTRVFTEEGTSVPVTVVEVEPNRITQVKTQETDGYSSIQVSSGKKRAALVNKAIAGHYAKAGVEPGRRLREYRLDNFKVADFKVGDELKVDLFSEGQKVDVQGVSKGKGFQGVVKRHGHAIRGRSNVSLSHRTIGSTGQCQTPGRVFKNRPMPGQMGNVKRTVQALEVVRVDVDRNLLLIRGAVPGAPGSEVLIMPSCKTNEESKTGGDS